MRAIEDPPMSRAILMDQISYFARTNYPDLWEQLNLIAGPDRHQKLFNLTDDIVRLIDASLHKFAPISPQRPK